MGERWQLQEAKNRLSELVRKAREDGPRPLPVIDSLISATAIVYGLTVVSRNVSDFERCGAQCVNPWQTL